MISVIHTLGVPFLASLLMLAVLSYLGMHVLAREIVFVDISLAQIAAVGTIAAHILFEVHETSILSYIWSFGFVLVAALFYAFARRKITQIPLEAVIGVTYAITAAAALFLVGITPGAHTHVQEMLSGSILWATWTDVVKCIVVFSAVGFCFFSFRKPLARISLEYDKAAEEGMRVVWWDLFFYILLGIVITVAVRIAGVVVVFTFLIIPATISALFSSVWAKRLLIAWMSGAVALILGLLFANKLDFSVGPSIAMFLGIVLVISGLSRILRPRSRAVPGIES